MVAFTCCQWLPLLPDSAAIVAMATRSGHVVVWDVAVPVVPGGRCVICGHRGRCVMCGHRGRCVMCGIGEGVLCVGMGEGVYVWA